MTGKSHKAMGLACGLACILVGSKNNDYLLTTSAVTTVIGCSLPDGDHNRTKLGRKRKMVIDVMKALVAVTLVGFVSVALYISLRSGQIVRLVIGAVTCILPIILCTLLSRMPAVQKAIKFHSKHRGIMHTAIPVVCMPLGLLICNNPTMNALVFGLQIGYLSHLFLDCLSKMGCPILYPITTKCIHGFIRSGSTLDYIATGVCCILVLHFRDVIYLAWCVVK